MIASTFKNQSSLKAHSAKKLSGFIHDFQQILEIGAGQNGKDEQLLFFHRSKEKKSIDQLVNDEITNLIQNTRSPVLILPPNVELDSVEKVCFIGNGEGLSDHPLLHQLVARYLPKPHRIQNKVIESIHWNNVFQIPEGIPEKHQLLPRELNKLLEEAEINLAVLPIPYKRPWWRSLWEISLLWNSSIPVLVFPF